MKRGVSQILIGMIAVLLGFMISFQFKSMYSLNETMNRGRINETPKEQNKDLAAKIDEYQRIVEAYEKSAASQSSVAKTMKNEIDKLRMLSGLTDIHGKGIEIIIKSSTDINTGDTSCVFAGDLMNIVNDLNSAGAEAISINGERYVERTQIRDVVNLVKINDSKFDPMKDFVIKAIGATDILKGIFMLPGSIADDLKEAGITFIIKPKEDITIEKYDKPIDYKFARNVIN